MVQQLLVAQLVNRSPGFKAHYRVHLWMSLNPIMR